MNRSKENKGKKTILFFHHCSDLGGAGISALNVLRNIPLELYKIIIYCKDDGGKMPEILKKEGFEVIGSKTSPTVFLHYSGGEHFIFSRITLINYIQIFKDIKVIRSIIAEINPDIIIVNSMTLFWIGKIAKEFSKETICFFREVYARGLFGIRTKMIKYFLSKYFDKVAFISNYELNQNKEIKSKKMTIYNMFQKDDSKCLIKQNEREKLSIEKDQFVVLFVGGMSKLKGTHLILKAISKLKEHNIVLLILGYKWDGKEKKISDCNNIGRKIKYLLGFDYEANCIKIILKNNLQHKVRLFESQTEVESYYTVCDVLVFPSTKPHQARPVFEAGYNKIPVVISDYPNTNENISENNGFLFKPNSINELSEIILKIAMNPKIAEEKVNNNYEITIRRHNGKLYSKNIQTLLTC